MFLVLAMCATGWCADLAQHLQDISVTIKSGTSSGSGVVVTRELDSKNGKVSVNFILTAGHVVANLRSVRTIVDPETGTERKVIEYAPVHIVKELTEDGRTVGETKMTGRVIKYSDADSRHDLAVIMLHKKNFVNANTEFYLDKEIPVIGTELFHVGSLLGQDGSNSMTTGIVSQIGRVLNLNGNNAIIFDQTTVTAFPGSSGGGVFLKSDGRYIGMLVRGAGETFNLIVPIRRLQDFAIDNKLEWLLDKNQKAPTVEEILEIPVDDVRNKTAVVNSLSGAAVAPAPTSKELVFPYLLKELE